MFTWLNGINLALNLASLILSCKAGYDHYKCYQVLLRLRIEVYMEYLSWIAENEG